MNMECKVVLQLGMLCVCIGLDIDRKKGDEQRNEVISTNKMVRINDNEKTCIYE